MDSNETLFILAGSLHCSVELVHQLLVRDHVSRNMDLGVADAEAAAALPPGGAVLLPGVEPRRPDAGVAGDVPHAEPLDSTDAEFYRVKLM